MLGREDLDAEQRRRHPDASPLGVARAKPREDRPVLRVGRTERVAFYRCGDPTDDSHDRKRRW